MNIGYPNLTAEKDAEKILFQETIIKLVEKSIQRELNFNPREKSAEVRDDIQVNRKLKVNIIGNLKLNSFFLFQGPATFEQYEEQFNHEKALVDNFIHDMEPSIVAIARIQCAYFGHEQLSQILKQLKNYLAHV